MPKQKTSKKKDKQRLKKQKSTQEIITFLESQWQTTIKYNCLTCLQKAYDSELNHYQGYITDDDLIATSKHKLLHK